MSPNAEMIDYETDSEERLIRLGEVVEKILSSPCFNSSKQCQHLLRYLIAKSSEPDSESLKERVIGIEVFGRKPDYNTGDDPVVRARVGEVRKRLAQFYQSKESLQTSLQLSIPSGSYRVAYRMREGLRISDTTDKSNPTILETIPKTEETGASVMPAVDVRQGHFRLRPWILGIIFGCLVLAALSLVLLRSHKTPQNALNQFWGLVLQKEKPILIYTGTNGVYAPAWNARQREHAPENQLYLPPLAEGSVLTSSDVHPINYEYTTVGDLQASVQVASFLSAQHQIFELRTGENIAVGDLRRAPSVLIGGGNNFWTMELANTLPIQYVPGVGIRDKEGSRTLWTDKLNADSTDGECYAIAARLIDTDTGNPLIIIAGVSSWGTRAAGLFVTDPSAMARFASAAPKNWERKNVEVVVRTNVLRRDAGPPTILAVRYW